MSPEDHHKLLAEVGKAQLSDFESEIEYLRQVIEDKDKEIESLKSATGEDSLYQLAPEALRLYSALFDEVPIPDLAGFERIQKFKELTTLVSELQAKGELTEGTYTPANFGPRDSPDLESFLTLYTGKDAAQFTGAVIKQLSKLAGTYFKDMVHFQGSTPDHVAAKRGAGLTHLAKSVDEKEQFRVLSGQEDARIDMFDRVIDDLCVVSDQAEYLSMVNGEARTLLLPLISQQGIELSSDASLVGMIRALSERDLVPQSSELKQTIYDKISTYDSLLIVGVDESLKNSTFAESYQPSIVAGSDLVFLARALSSLLEDHVTLSSSFKKDALSKRERDAIKLLKAKSAKTARRQLETVLGVGEQVDAADASVAAVYKSIGKTYQVQLERSFKERLDDAERDSKIAWYERLDKPEKYKFLSSVFVDLFSTASELMDADHGILSLPEQIEAAQQQLGSNHYRIERHLRYVDRLEQIIEGQNDADDLSAPISVCEGMLAKEEQQLEHDIGQAIMIYRRGKNGINTLHEAKERLENLDRPLDKLLKTSYRGMNLSAEQELAKVTTLIERYAHLVKDKADLAFRKGHAIREAHLVLSKLGTATCPESYEGVKEYVSHQRAAITKVRDLQEKLSTQEQQFDSLMRSFSSDDDTASTYKALHGLHQALVQSQHVQEGCEQEYHRAAKKVLKHTPDDYHLAKEQLDTVVQALDAYDQLAGLAKDYIAGFKSHKKSLNSLSKVSTHLLAAKRKADALVTSLLGVHEEVSDSVGEISDYLV